MEVTSSDEITPDLAVAKREEMGLSMRQFWSGVRVNPSSGYAYENNQTKHGLPGTVRELLFLKYWIGLPVGQPASAFEPITGALAALEEDAKVERREAATQLVEDAKRLGIKLTPAQLRHIEAVAE